MTETVSYGSDVFGFKELPPKTYSHPTRCMHGLLARPKFVVVFLNYIKFQ